MDVVARSLVVFGAGLVLVGALLWLASRLPFLGRLPGDFVFTRGSATLAFPLVTSIVASIVLTVLLTLALRLWR